jgi:hypothetical protein
MAPEDRTIVHTILEGTAHACIVQGTPIPALFRGQGRAQAAVRPTRAGARDRAARAAGHREYRHRLPGTHCAFPSAQDADVQAFLDEFLPGKEAANVTKTPCDTAMKKWITWETPQLQ